MRAWLVTIGAMAVALAFPLSALADLESDVHEGQQLAEEVRSGDRNCAELSAGDLELVGEYAMGRYLGSTPVHEAMNQRMTQIMGEAGERRMHIALGYRYSGCRGGPASNWIGPMAGMMYGRGGPRGYGQGPAGYRPRMMGGQRPWGERGYAGSMMGSAWHQDSGVSTLGAVLIALASALIGGGVAAFAMRR